MIVSFLKVEKCRKEFFKVIAKQENRLTYIDYLETIAMFCVVCCHYYAVMGNGVSANMYMLFAKCFGVPIFLLANGALMFQRKFSLRKHLKKIGMLIVTTAAWKAVYLLIQYIRLPAGSCIWKISDLWNYFCGGNLSNPYVPSEHFWYMYALIGVYLVFPLFAAIYEEKKTYYFYLISLLFFIPVITEIDAFIANITNINISFSVIRSAYFPFAQAGYYLLFFLLGPLLHQYFYKSDKKKKNRIIALGIAIVGVALLMVEYYMQNGTLGGVYQPLQGDYQRFATLLMAAGVYSLFATFDWKITKIDSIMKFISVRTIGIYAAHMMLAYLFSPWIINRTSRTGVYMLVLQALIVMIGSIIITEIFSMIPGIRTILGLNYYKMRKNYWEQKKLQHKKGN